MKKLALILIATLLMGMSFVGCGINTGAPTREAAIICGASILVTAIVVATAASGQEEEAAVAESQGLSHGDVLSLLPSCIEFGYDLLSLSSSNSQALEIGAFHLSSPRVNAGGSPHVTFSDKYSLNGVASGKVYDITLGNCTPSLGIPTLKLQLNFSFSIPFIMAVGSKGSSSTFHLKPTGTSNFDFVGRAVFDRYRLNGVIPRVKQTVNLEIGPYKKVTLNLLVTMPYMYGIARLDQNSSTSYVPWVFTGTKSTGQFTLGTQNC